jgi:hypothetical protein
VKPQDGRSTGPGYWGGFVWADGELQRRWIPPRPTGFDGDEKAWYAAVMFSSPTEAPPQAPPAGECPTPHECKESDGYFGGTRPNGSAIWVPLPIPDDFTPLYRDRPNAWHEWVVNGTHPDTLWRDAGVDPQEMAQQEYRYSTAFPSRNRPIRRT